jgi:imidazolonepropionase-like amidohydrolase
MTVEVANGKVERVFHTGDAALHPVKSKVKSIDGTGKFLIPGLWICMCTAPLARGCPAART